MHRKILTLTTLLSTALAIPSFSIRQVSCQAQADACRVAPGANQAYCSAQYAACLGFNPYTGSPPLSTMAPPPIVTGSNPPADPIYTPVPIYTNGTTTPTGYTKTVVQSFSTYVPGPTTLTYGSKTYTITGPTTLTVTDCPCTLTVPVASGATPIPIPATATATTPAGNGGNGGNGGKPTPTSTAATGTTTTPSSYAGTANVKEPAIGLAVFAVGAFALLM